jgi:hypothetical protein
LTRICRLKLAELEALDNSLDSMIETFEDVKELIDEALNIFRRNKLAVVRSSDGANTVTERLVQFSIGGIDVWRRLLIAETCSLLELHHIIQIIFSWQNAEDFKYTAGGNANVLAEPVPETFALNTKIEDLVAMNHIELLYEYGAKWVVKIMILSRQETPGNRPPRCVAGDDSSPPEFIDGPVKFKRLLSALENGNDLERQNARQKLGPDFDPGEFDLEACNRSLSTIHN